MKTRMIVIGLLAVLVHSYAQHPGIPVVGGEAIAPEVYKSTKEKVFDLLHTRLEVSFDYSMRRMPGKAWLTLTPHFYANNTLRLDAKGMYINKVALVNGKKITDLPFNYADSLQLVIALDKTYAAGENLTVFIDYVARPDEMKFQGSKAITDAKGLYFINPDGKDSTKPIQIWTQGETEATSVWCPTIDATNQKCTQEISMTVPAQYVSLSNGMLVKQVKHKNGTRTDTWKMDLPHSPYLFFMGVGDFAIIHDKYKNIPVDYYVEKRYASVARRIFGDTPAMIDFFSNLLGVPYPWPKYAQMVGRDYVSGAMENTTATLHGSDAYQNARQLTDENAWEIVVAHELFHQWFGDLVTAESWSNLTVNESFADYSEYLWLEHKYGKDRALHYNQEAAEGYLATSSDGEKHLVRFDYADKEEMFDAVSYQKGGRILNMLRHYLGDSAFFKGLELYLNQNRFKAAEAHQLRLALEEVSGKDLNWFFNQWYYGSGHPEVSIQYQYIDSRKEIAVIIDQQQEGRLFYMPIDIDVYQNDRPTRYTVWMKGPSDTFHFKATQMPQWVNVDAEKLMLWEKENKQDVAHWIAQARLGKNYLDRAEALQFAIDNFDSSEAMTDIITNALKDPFFEIRKEAINGLANMQGGMNKTQLTLVTAIASSDEDPRTRAAAISALGFRYPKGLEDLFVKSALDSSYTLAGAGYEALVLNYPDKALQMKAMLQQDAQGKLKSSIITAGYLEKDVAMTDSVSAQFMKLNLWQKLSNIKGMMVYANRLQSEEDFKKITEPVFDLYEKMPSSIAALKPVFQPIFVWLEQQKEQALQASPGNIALQQQLRFIKQKVSIP